ncbi:Alpha/Beta hydrolase protein [Trichophaea hybrida]|nr:Alpha/Beta hydrolase protein [Trichophaea hybrida]
MRPTPLPLLLLLTGFTNAASSYDSCPAETRYPGLVNAGAKGKPIYELGVQGARDFLESVQAPGSPSLDTVDYKVLNLPIGPTGSVNVHLFRPLGSGKKVLPVIVYFHGGGWILGSPNTHRRLVLDLVAETGAAVLFSNYTRSPEATFPVPIQQSHAVVDWLHAHGSSFYLDSERIAFAGDSAGGAMAAAVNIISIEAGRKELLPKYQVLFYPVTDVSKKSCTYKIFKNGPGLATVTLHWMIGAFVPHKKDRLNPLASPLLAKDAVLKSMPETLLMVAEVDPLRAESEAFARRLSKNRVRTTVLRVEATVHDFVMLNGLSKTPAARVAIEAAGRSIKKALGT